MPEWLLLRFRHCLILAAAAIIIATLLFLSVSGASVSLVLVQPEVNTTPADADAECFIPRSNAVNRSCNLKACMFHDHRAPRLFLDEPTDGAGHRMKVIIEGMAVAQRNGMNFGGLRSNPNDRITEHGNNFRDIVGRFFGCRAEREFYPAPLPSFSATLNHVQDLERSGPFAAFAPILLWEAQEWPYNKSASASEYFPFAFRTWLQGRLMLWPLFFAPEKPAVALHVRRGDLERGNFRATPDTYYFGVVEAIRKQLPDADVHVWSSTALGMWRGKATPWWNSSDFDGYTARGMRVHLDDSDLLSVWAHLSRARVFVMAQSSFSFVPAVLNVHCVVYPGNMRKGLEGWIDGTLETGRFESELRACIAAAGSPKPLTTARPP